MPRRERRSQAERTADTRARIVAAAVDSIAEGGLSRATAADITRRAGVTWGAVQHHFGGKEGVYLAVVEHSFDRFADSLADVPVAGSPIEARVDSYIDRAWRHFSSAHYRSSYEILANHSAADGGGLAGEWRDEMARAWNAVWNHFFGDTGLSRRHSAILAHYTMSVLSGLALMRGFAGPTTSIAAAELDLLKATLVREAKAAR